MNIGHPKRVIEIEPTSLPLPSQEPVPVEPSPVEPSPVVEPSEPQPVERPSR